LNGKQSFTAPSCPAAPHTQSETKAKHVNIAMIRQGLGLVIAWQQEI
jgi:hypothetical protein